MSDADRVVGTPRTVASDAYSQLSDAAHTVISGQERVFELLCVALFTGGHVLLEGVPGTAKTLMARTLARLVDARYRRIQFTPDLMPSDVVGTSVFDLRGGTFNLRKGPIFTQVLLADEINRAPAKTQSALLEAMQEHQVTLEGETYPLDEPFFVVATQNPVEYEGTYPLPEAQLDRFLLKVDVTYPDESAELDVLRAYDRGRADRPVEAVLTPTITPAQLAHCRQSIQATTVDDSILAYVLALVTATRTSHELALGASPRAGIALLLAAKTLAAFRGRDYVTPDDIKQLTHPALRHRLTLTAEAQIDGLTPDGVIDRVLARVPVPR